MHAKHYRDKGEARTARPVAPKDEAPPTVEAMAKALHATFWSRRTVSEGTKGPLVYECTTRQVTLCRDGLPDRAVWLIIKRSCGAQPSSGYDISHAPLSVRVPLFVWLSGVRWAIEHCDEEATTDLGLDHAEVRKYPGWPHHRLVCMFAHFFLGHLKIRLGENSASLDLVPDTDIVGGDLTIAQAFR
jgi:SRSO17 transposase